MTPRRANNIGRNVGVDRILPGCFDLPRRAIYDGCLGASFAQLGYGVPHSGFALSWAIRGSAFKNARVETT